jgi:mannose-6-phosphate isomerase-like protein (cupin superfamily)
VASRRAGRGRVQNRKPKKGMENLYKGFTPKTNHITRIANPTDAQSFFKYVSTRTPIHITTQTELNEKEWTIPQLVEKVGNVKVKVETRENEQFGTGNERLEMSFGDLVRRFEAGDESLYLTTQYEGNDTEQKGKDTSEKGVAQPPLDSLTGLFPPKPSILDTLITQQINLWMGCTRAPTSSGLHHDFADNLYIVLKGRKKFTIYSPKDAEKMYLNGKVDTIHTNGLITYEEHIRSDGARLSDVSRWKLKKIESEISELSEKQRSVEEDERMLVLEDVLEEEMENALEYGTGSDFEEDLPKKRAKTSTHPPSFSKIAVADMTKFAKYPKLKKAVKVEVELKAGEMLYLPASWFHEVESFGEEDGVHGLHMALNYWLHPPATHDYEKPYEDEFWKENSL